MTTKEQLELYRNYLATLYYHQEYGDKYGDTQELIEMYERKLNMKEPYKWNYNIKVKTKEGTYEYEDKLENLDSILERHPNYEEVEAKQRKPKMLVKQKPIVGRKK